MSCPLRPICRRMWNKRKMICGTEAVESGAAGRSIGIARRFCTQRGERVEKIPSAEEPEPAQRHDAEPSAPAAQPAAPFSWCKLIPLTLKIMSAVILLIGLFLAIQGAMSTSPYSSFYEIYPQTMTYFDAYFFFDTLLSWLCRSAVIFALGEIIDLLTHRHSD